ncbi:MAG: glycogen debranching N-terminal domain-containing protein [Thermomicrobiales bacterium]
MDTTEQALRAVPILHEVSRAGLRRIARQVRVREYPAGAIIVSPDDTDRTFYLLLQGRVKVVRHAPPAGREELLAEFGPGEFFGEMALLDSAPRLADVIAQTPATCALVGWDIFLAEFLGNPAIATALLATMSRRLRARGETLGAIEEALGGVSLLGGLSSAELRRIAERTQVREYPEGAQIVAQNDPGRTLYIVLKGRVRVERRADGRRGAMTITEFGTGEFFGEMALLEDARRSADVVALAPTTCALLDWEVFHQDLLGNRAVATALLASLSRRLRAFNELLEPRVETPAPAHERERRIFHDGESGMTGDIRTALVIKEENHFTLFDPEGNIPINNTSGLGVYLGDTRHLSGYEISLGKVQPVVLVSTAQLGYAAEQQLTNRDLMVRRKLIHKETLLISRERVAHETGFHETVTVRNFNPFAVDIEIVARFCADFADIFEVRGIGRERRGRQRAPVVRDNSVTLRYDGLDKRQYLTTLEFAPSPTRLSPSMMTYRATVNAFDQTAFSVRISAHVTADASGDGRATAPAPPTLARIAQARQSYADWLEQTTQVTTDNELFNAAIARSLADLRLLVNRLGDNWYFAAGIPWFATLFGRDSLVTGLQTLAWNPDLAAGILRLLARYQGTENNDWRDEEPGKILHELRTGELAQTGQIPHTPYYGSIDSTPLFLMLAAAYFDWTGDERLILDILPNIDAALHWCWQYGDLDGDGYIEYTRRSSKGLANQGWKDSGEGIMFRDDRMPEPPLALVEVQGYLYAAYQGIARVFQALGGERAAEAARLVARAAALQTSFNRDFWMADDQYFALGLDGAKQQIDAIASNPGQALWTGIVDDIYAPMVSKRLLDERLFSGWGIRTLARDNAAYNPLGYHLGTVWPHDNALITAGLLRYGFTTAANRVLTALYEAALQFPYYRLPELFCGIPRTDYGVPVGYPVACSPQAWAAGTLPFMLGEALRLEPAEGGRVLTIARPILPAWLGTVTLRGLRVGKARLDLTFTRTAGPEAPAAIAVTRQEGELDVRIHAPVSH